MKSRWILMVALAVATLGTMGCGDEDDAKVGMGGRCRGNPESCADGLYCLSPRHGSSQEKIADLCTMNCTSQSGNDTCRNAYPNTRCFNSVCAKECGNGLSCAEGTRCDPDTRVCVAL